MKAIQPTMRRALTLLEVLVVIFVIAMLALLILPKLAGYEHPARRVNCVNNLKNVGLVLRIFSTDRGGKWPMDLAVTNGGTREYMGDANELWRHWRVLSEIVSTPKILLCPADKDRLRPEPFWSSQPQPTMDQMTNNSHLSYFLGLNASEDQPQTILAGDRNLTTNGVPIGPGRLVLQTNTALSFTAEIHSNAGNVLRGDGSVQQVTSRQLTKAWHAAQTNSGLGTNVWLVP